MPSALLVNPNTSGWVTRRLAAHLRAQWQAAGTSPSIRLSTATARFGASYIASEAAFAIAAHATLDAVARAGARTSARVPAGPESSQPFDAVVVGCFGDPGLAALESLLPVPVIGLAQAAFDEARAHGRFAIVTGGTAWKGMLERIVRALGHEAALTRIVVIERSGGELAADPALARRLLADACREAIVGGDSASVVLGGAAFAGFGDAIAGELPVPVIDSVSAAGRAVAAAVAQAPVRSAAVGVDTADYRGINPALARQLARRD